MFKAKTVPAADPWASVLAELDKLFYSFNGNRGYKEPATVTGETLHVRELLQGIAAQWTLEPIDAAPRNRQAKRPG